jgi:hypothetical protein
MVPGIRSLACAAVFALMVATPASAAPTAPGPADDGQLVIHVLVPLCDNDQIDCGSTRAGDPDDLEHNLYWGAMFGQKRYFGRKSSTFKLLSTETLEGARLERVIYSKKVPGKPFGREGEVDLLVVLDAYRGDAIDQAVDDFYLEAERGARVDDPRDESAEPTLRVDVVGWAGHNRMMDGKEPPPRAKPSERRPIPSFVLACRSAAWFEAPLKERGSTPLVLTRDLMAPEGYVVEAVALGLGAAEPRTELRRRAVAAYAKWQKIEEKTAGSIFAKLL